MLVENIDDLTMCFIQSIGLRLLQTALEDGSPLVRRELVVALQWLIYSFLPNFVNLCRALQEEDEERVRLSTPPTAQPPSPRGTLNRVPSEEKLRRKSEMVRRQSRLGPNGGTPNISSSTSYNEINTVGVADTSALGTPRKSRKHGQFHQLQSSYSALASLSIFSNVTRKFKPFFLKVWGGLLLLEKDPDPTAALLARSLLDVVWRKMVQKDRSADIHRSHTNPDSHSRSAPNSPIRPTFLLGESPPASLNITLPTHLEGSESKHGPQSWLQRSLVSAINEEGILLEDGETNGISTQFIEWSARYFSTQLMRLNGQNDTESEEYWGKEWMYSRNCDLLKKADGEKCSLLEGSGRLDEQIGVAKLIQPPSVIAMHPFDNEVVVAGRDTVSVYEFHNAQHKSNSFSNKNPKISQITALEFLNRHEDGLLVTGTDDGVVRVYRDWHRQQRLVAAWNLLPELVPQAAAHGNR